MGLGEPDSGILHRGRGPRSGLPAPRIRERLRGRFLGATLGSWRRWAEPGDQPGLRAWMPGRGEGRTPGPLAGRAHSPRSAEVPGEACSRLTLGGTWWRLRMLVDAELTSAAPAASGWLPGWPLRRL